MRLLIFSLVASFFILSSCARNVHMKHGKELPAQLVAQLKKGMTRIEVDRLLGTPATTTPYGQNEWVYIYRYSETWTKFGDGAIHTDEKNLTIYFDNNNRVKDFTTNYL